MIPDKYSANPFAESDSDDDEDDGKSSKKKKAAKKSAEDTAPSEPYANSLRFKEGRNVQNTLYYVDHSKLANEGNGLLPEKRNELLCNIQGSTVSVCMTLRSNLLYIGFYLTSYELDIIINYRR